MEPKKIGAIAILAAVVIVGAFVLTSMRTGEKQMTTGTNPTPTTLAENSLKEVQVVACNAADEAKTCKTKLDKLIGLVTWQDCCKYLGKCC